jgi:hypothetical protein
MTQEEFIKVLNKEVYTYEIEGDNIIVTYSVGADLRYLTSLPPGVVFKTGWSVDLRSLTSLPPGVEFRNKGHVRLDALTSIPSDVVFSNEGVVYLDALIGGRFDEWQGNIEGIDSKRLLNMMISKGVFER